MESCARLHDDHRLRREPHPPDTTHHSDYGQCRAKAASSELPETTSRAAPADIPLNRGCAGISTPPGAPHHKTTKSYSSIACQGYPSKWRTLGRFWSQIEGLSTVAVSKQTLSEAMPLLYQNVKVGTCVDRRPHYALGWLENALVLSDQAPGVWSRIPSFLSIADSEVVRELTDEVTDLQK